MQNYKCVPTNTMKIKENMLSQKENYNSSAADLKGTNYYNLNDKEFKIAVLKKFNEVEEIRKTTQ